MTIENKDKQEDINLEGLDSKKILETLYNKELNSKKSILEYISIIKNLKKDALTKEQLQDTYTLIYENIEEMKSVVKTNTIMHLKNELKGQLGKFVENKDPKKTNNFIEFFKEAYPPKQRKKDYTFVLVDESRITEEQIWHTLTYINALCLKNTRLSYDEKDDIIKYMNILLKSKNIKYINQVKSLEKLQRVLKVKVVSDNKGFKVKRER